VSGALLTDEERAFLLGCRRIVLCTIAADGSARPAPVCFAVLERGGNGGTAAVEVLYTALDEKPKRVADPHLLARVRDIEACPEVTLLADRWDEDWGKLAWLRLHGTATLLEPGATSPPGAGTFEDEHVTVVSALRARYPQYTGHDLAARPIIRVAITRVLSWGTLG
jgi:PPOX class probable F420-dependent enzyme